MLLKDIVLALSTLSMTKSSRTRSTKETEAPSSLRSNKLKDGLPQIQMLIPQPWKLSKKNLKEFSILSCQKSIKLLEVPHPEPVASQVLEDSQVDLNKEVALVNPVDLMSTKSIDCK